MGRGGAGHCTIFSHCPQESFGRTSRITLKRPGTYSSVSGMSSPNGLSAPPQSGQSFPGSWRCSSRGRCAGNGRRAGLLRGAESEYSGGSATRGASASVIVSRASCSCAISASNRAERRPKRIRWSTANCSFRASISRSRYRSWALAAASASRLSVKSRFSCSMSSGSSGTDESYATRLFKTLKNQ